MLVLATTTLLIKCRFSDACCKVKDLLGEHFILAHPMGNDGVINVMSFLKASPWKFFDLTFIIKGRVYCVRDRR